MDSVFVKIGNIRALCNRETSRGARHTFIYKVEGYSKCPDGVCKNHLPDASRPRSTYDRLGQLLFIGLDRQGHLPPPVGDNTVSANIKCCERRTCGV